MKLAGSSLVLFTLLLVFVPAIHAQNQCSDPKAHSGRIVGITGNWFVANGGGKAAAEQLRFGRSICSNACVEGDGGKLMVQFGNVFVSFACDGPSDPHCKQDSNERCSRLITDTQPPGKSWVVALAAEFIAMFQQPERYITPVSRGLEPHLADTVLALNAQAVDFAPAFADMDPGMYKLRIEPMQGTEPAFAVDVEWRGTGPASSVVAGLQPSLYRLVRLPAESEAVEPGSWALIEGQDLFARDSASFRLVQDQIRQLPDGIDPRVPGAILRAELDSLAKGATAKR